MSKDRGGCTLCAGVHDRVEGDGIGGDALPLHAVKEIQGQLPAARPLACTDQAGIRDHVALALCADLQIVCQTCSGLLDLLQ